MNETQRLPTAKKWLRSVWPLAAAMSVVLSCSMFSSAPAVPTNTPLPIATNTPNPSNTPLPADTSQPVPTKKATPNRGATQAAQQQDTAAAATNFAGEALGAVSDSLNAAGETMGAGSVVFWNPADIPVESSKPNVVSHVEMDPSVQGADFAFHSNITWETKQKVGIVYCLFMFRISGDLSMDPWYMMRMGRISGLGHIYFDVMQGWTIMGENNGDASNYIRDENGATNEVLLVARANQFTAYVNGKQVSVWWNTKIDRGGFGLGTLQDTGASVCTFANTWIYDFE